MNNDWNDDDHLRRGNTGGLYEHEREDNDCIDSAVIDDAIIIVHFHSFL